MTGESATHRGGYLPNEVLLDEEFDNLFAQAAGREGPHGRSFSLDLDEDILDGLLGNSGDLVGLRVVAVLYGRLRSDHIPE